MSDRDDNGRVTGEPPAHYTPEEKLAYLRGQIDMIARLHEVQLMAGRENGAQ